MSTASTGVHCVVVTPEKTELDVHCNALTLPLFDGELGVLPGRAPMVGRLGFGLLRLKESTGESTWFVDGGFVQITREAVFILTDRLLKPETIDRAQAQSDLDKANEIKANSPESLALRERALSQARAKLRFATK